MTCECIRHGVMIAAVAVIVVVGALACNGEPSPEADALRFFDELRRGDVDAARNHSSEPLEELQECSGWLQRHETARIRASVGWCDEPSAAEELEGLGTKCSVDIEFAAREKGSPPGSWEDHLVGVYVLREQGGINVYLDAVDWCR